MSAEFIKQKTGSNQIDLAIKQQEQLSYFTQSSIQDEVNVQYINQWAERNYISNDFFLNWVKAIFKTENFLSFYKYFRKPLPSARLVNDRLKPSLERVFHAEDSYFNYTIKGQNVVSPDELDDEKFKQEIFNALLYNYNDILIHDLKDINTPFRDLLSINKVVAIDSYKSTINKLAYTACVTIDDKKQHGYLYMDDKSYIFYDKDYEELLNIPHDLGKCPADYIAAEPFGKDDVVRKSIFSYVKEEFEEYVFLKTLQRMTEPNGAIPVVSMLDVKDDKRSGDTKDGLQGEPMSSTGITSQQASQGTDLIGNVKSSPYQAGSVVKVPIVTKADDSIDMDVVKNFLNFFYIPTEALEYLNKRIKEIEKSILVDVLGDHSEENEKQKNELQVSKSYVNKQDKLRRLSKEITRVINLSDHKLLSLKYGSNSVKVDCFCGSDFFLETEQDLYDLFKLSPNTIERKSILVRLSQNKNKFNPKKAEKERLQYNLMPFASDIDFDKASARGLVDDITYLYQTRFTYWIDKFESTYGDLLFFYNLIEGTESEKESVINQLINNIIKEYYEQTKSSTPASV